MVKCSDGSIDTLSQSLGRNRRGKLSRQSFGYDQVFSFDPARCFSTVETAVQMCGHVCCFIRGQLAVKPCLEGSFTNAVSHRFTSILPYVRVNSLRARAIKLPTWFSFSESVCA